jgi:hypothetical protein
MADVLAIIYVVTCVILIVVMFRRRDLLDVQFGVLAVFSIGYFPLPVLFKPMTDLVGYEDDQIAVALLIHWLFLLSVIGGAAAMKKFGPTVRPLSFGALDAFVARKRYSIATLAFAMQVAYAATGPATSYATEDFTAYFEEKSLIFSILAAGSGLCVGFVAVSYARAASERSLRAKWAFGAMLVAIVALTLPLGQRLAVLTPVMIALAAMSATQQVKKAFRILVIAVAVLAIVSPFAVYLREARRTHSGQFLSASDVVQDYQLSDNPFSQSFQSILNRSDLVMNTIVMKDYIDRTEYVGLPYYYSVIVSPVPRFLYPGKPYILSANGKIDGEISVLAWRVMVGGLGSLSAFGGLTAYREGGWAAILVDGLADGAFFFVIARWLGGGGWVARILYANFFVMFVVGKAPSDFFESLTAFLGQVPVMIVLYLISRSPLVAGARQMGDARATRVATSPR